MWGSKCLTTMVLMSFAYGLRVIFGRCLHEVYEYSLNDEDHFLFCWLIATVVFWSSVFLSTSHRLQTARRLSKFMLP